MKVTIVGGGGFRVPLVYTALLGLRDRLGIDELVLHDVEQARLDRIAPVLSGLAIEKGAQLPFRSTTDLTDAIQGADFVLCAIRVGQLEGRVVDESVPLGFGVLGQETTGPGGLCFALRTIPVMMELARTIRQHAPNAWLINFTNPAGMVTEAVQRELGDRAIGICDSPAGLLRRVARALDRDPQDLWFNYFGLNHLGWLQGVRDHERDLLPDLLGSDQRLSTFEEGRLFGGEWLRSLEMIPNEYLYYFYYAADTVNAIRESEDSRGTFLLRQQSAFYAEGEQPPHAALDQWRQTRHDRERTYMAEARSAAGDCHDHLHDADDNGGYEVEAMAVLEAIALNSQSVQILNTANRSALSFLDGSAVVEVPCVVGRTGPVPIAVGEVQPHARALVETMKDVERTTIDAALSGSRRQAIRALALHPLVPSVSTAREIFDGYCERLPGLAEAFQK